MLGRSDATAGGRAGPLRIVVHDYAGHSFPISLSRELAESGHTVLHLYCGTVTSPRGAVDAQPNVAGPLTIRPISHRRQFQKYQPLTRLRQEREYGRLAAREVEAFRPDVVISANTPLVSQATLLRTTRRSRAAFVFWLQDLLGIGVSNVLARRLGRIGRFLAYPLVALERMMLRKSDAVIAIAGDFISTLPASVRTADTTFVIENWAPLADVPLRPRENEWRRTILADEDAMVLYAGTLGRKHDPRLLLELARSAATDDAMRVVVISEGPGAEWLKASAKTAGLRRHLLVLPFQPYELVPDVMAAADLALVLLEGDASRFSVPSKTLTYLSAGRPIVAAVPRENLAARIVERVGAGVVVPPGDGPAFTAAVRRVLGKSEFARAMSAAGRAYATAAFDVVDIAEKFETVFEAACLRRKAAPSRMSALRRVADVAHR